MFLVNDLSEVISADLVELGDHVIHDLFMVCGSRSEFSKVAPQLSKQDDCSPDISVQRDVVQRCWKLVVESGGAIKTPLPSDVRTAIRDVRLTRMLTHALATGAISLPTSTTTTSSIKSTTNTSSSSSSSSTSSFGGFGAPNVTQEPNADSSHVSSQHDASTSSVGLAPGVVSTTVRLSSDSDRGEGSPTKQTDGDESALEEGVDEQNDDFDFPALRSLAFPGDGGTAIRLFAEKVDRTIMTGATRSSSAATLALINQFGGVDQFDRSRARRLSHESNTLLEEAKQLLAPPSLQGFLRNKRDQTHDRALYRMLQRLYPILISLVHATVVMGDDSHFGDRSSEMAALWLRAGIDGLLDFCAETNTGRVQAVVSAEASSVLRSADTAAHFIDSKLHDDIATLSRTMQTWRTGNTRHNNSSSTARASSAPVRTNNSDNNNMKNNNNNKQQSNNKKESATPNRRGNDGGNRAAAATPAKAPKTPADAGGKAN